MEVYQNALRYLKQAYGDLLLRELTGRHLTDLYLRMRQQGLSLRQCEIVHRVAGQMLRAAVAEKLIARDVSRDVANPPRPVYQEPRAMESSEVQAILQAAERPRRWRWYVAFRLALDAAFRACCQEAGVADAVFHGLRATVATWLAEAGVPPKTTMRRLGHSSLQTTLRYYTRMTDRGQKDAARALSDRLREQA